MTNATATAQAVTEKVAEIKSTSKTATRPIKAKLDRLREIRAIIKPLEVESKALTAEILEWAGEGVKRIVWGKTQLATIVPNKNVTYNGEILKQAFPEAYAASLVEKAYKQIR